MTGQQTSGKVPVATMVRWWCDEHPGAQFVMPDVLRDVAKSAGIPQEQCGPRSSVRACVHTALTALSKKGVVRAAGGKRGNMKLWQVVVGKPLSQPEDGAQETGEGVAPGPRHAEYIPPPTSAPDPPTPPSPIPTPSISEYDMGRSIFNYIVHLKNELNKAHDESRRLGEQMKLREAEHNRMIRVREEKVAGLQDEIAQLRQQLAQASVVRRRARSLPLTEITRGQ